MNFAGRDRIRNRVSPNRYRDDETAGSIRLRRSHRLAAMQPRNLSHQRKPEPGSLAISGELEERLKDLLALRLGDAAAPIDDAEDCVCAVATQRDAHRRLAVALSVLEEIADQPPQQSRIAGE